MLPFFPIDGKIYYLFMNFFTFYLFFNIPINYFFYTNHLPRSAAKRKSDLYLVQPREEPKII